MSQKPRFSKPIKKQTMAEQVADAIRESILDGQWEGGEALPTEPELAEAFGVSRAVIRDATRMLVALGLVEAQHGRGVFVTESQVEAFGDALLLALRRGGATVWDVEHFEQIIYPEVIALAAVEATEEEVEAIREAGETYLETVGTVFDKYWDVDPLPEDISLEMREKYRNLIEMIFAATHNQVLQLLAGPLLRLRNMRTWQDEALSAEDAQQMEATYFQIFIDAIASRDPDGARETLSRIMQLPPEAVQAMRQTPVGKTPIIPVDRPKEWDGR